MGKRELVLEIETTKKPRNLEETPIIGIPLTEENVFTDETKKNQNFQLLDKLVNEAYTIYLDVFSKDVSGLVITEEDLEVLQLETLRGIPDIATESEISKLLAETACYLAIKNYMYANLAGIISMCDFKRKYGKFSFSEVIEKFMNHKHPVTEKPAPLVTEKLYEIVMKNKFILDSAIVKKNDYQYDYFGWMTLKRSYLLKTDEVVESPQHMFMRTSIGIHGDSIEDALETYFMMVNGYFIHASPTLFNAGTPLGQLSSCFLLQMTEDSISGIYDTLKRCAMISKSAGGVGLSVHNIRANGSYISGTNGISNGLVPLLKVYNDTARYVDQGGCKRKGAFAIYLEPWHSDIYDFLSLKKNTGKEESRARDLFYALWIPDLFMKRVKANQTWSLFCPNEAVGLSDCWGDDFEVLYLKYEQKGIARKTVKAQHLWFSILESQIETGTPYMLYKDSCNRKSNQQNLGTIKQSNLCTEIIEFTSPDEVAVCNLASISLAKFVENGEYNFQKLAEVVAIVTRNLNKVIDVTVYPLEEAKKSNLRHRPIGIGVQGLSDTFMQMNLPFESEEAISLNKKIFETIYFAALTASKDLAMESGPYESYYGSPSSKGILQFDLWDVKPSNSYDWEILKKEIQIWGLRNSLLVAIMPTASTSQILGNNECIEPITSNIYIRRVLSGEYPVINKYLVRDINKLGLWNSKILHKIMEHNGSVQEIEEIPKEIRNVHKTVWEIKQKVLVDMAADRGAFVDQSQSFNVFMSEPSISKLTSMHFYGFEKGLKTGMYYLRSKPAANAIQFTLQAKSIQLKKKQSSECTDEVCLNCSS